MAERLPRRPHFLRSDRNKDMECETSPRPEASAAATGILRGGLKAAPRSKGRVSRRSNREKGRC